MEVEYYPDQWEELSWYRKNLDYCILGQHHIVFEGTSIYKVDDRENLMAYVDALENGCKHALCDYICHPDVVLWNYPSIDGSVKEAAERIAEISLRYNMPLELNCGSGVLRDMKTYEDGVVIRPIVPGDEALIEDFFGAMGGESRAFFNRGDGNKLKTIEFCQQQNVGKQYWMAIEGDKMVGLVFLWDLCTTLPWLGIAVREDYKGKHIGTRLIAYAQEYAKEQGKGGIQLTTHVANLRAQTLYETMGFTLVGPTKNGTEFFYLYRYREKN
jgi:ribosomal protein S18 acetylase RimI-like enzyme